MEAILALCRSDQGHDRVLVPGADALRSFDALLLSAPGRFGERAATVSGSHSTWDEIRDLPFGAGVFA